MISCYFLLLVVRSTLSMGEELLPSADAGEINIGGDGMSSDQWLLKARQLLPAALRRAKEAKGYQSRWKMVIPKLDQVPTCLSDLSSHPFFSKNALFREQLQSICGTLEQSTELAGLCSDDHTAKLFGKLQMQSDLDFLIGKLELNLRDCRLLVKTGILGEATSSSILPELLARLQIGDAESKNRAMDGLLELMREDENRVLGVLRRSNIAAMIELLSAASAKVREKAATLICRLAESGSFDGFLVSEGLLPSLIKSAESGSPVVREKAVVSLLRLSLSPETAKMITGHGGVRPIVELCRAGDSVSKIAAFGVIKNLSLVPEIRQSLADEGAIRAILEVLDSGAVAGLKENAARCLQNLTAGNESLRRTVVAEGGVPILLAYMEGSIPHESAIGALKNLVGCVPVENLIKLGLLPRTIHILKAGTLGAKQAAASTICKISNSSEMKKLVGESGCLPLLVKMLEEKSCNAREVAAQAISSLIGYRNNAAELKEDDKIVPNLVQLLDPNPMNSAKKYAVACLLHLSSTARCRKKMISHGAVGYLKKLREMEVPGARKLLRRLERGRFQSFFSRKSSR